MEYNAVDKVLESAFAHQKQERSSREIVLKRAKPKGVWLASAATVAVGLFLVLKPAPEPDFVCYVDGVRIENRDEAMEIVRRTLDKVSNDMQLVPREVEVVNGGMRRVSNELRRVNEIFNQKPK